MSKSLFSRILVSAGGLVVLWITVRYALPVLLPFALGAGLALAAEPLVALLCRRLKMGRWLAAGLGVSIVIALLVTLVVLLIALLLRQAGQLAEIMPSLAQSVHSGMTALEGWLLDMAASAPKGLRPALTEAVTDLFSDGSSLMGQLTQRLVSLATVILGALTRGALGLITGVLSAYMLSARLPKLRAWGAGRLPPAWHDRYLPALKGMKKTLTGWLCAQLKLTLITLVLLTVGFLLLGIPSAPVWAAAVALVDALPILGTGIVLLPWSLVCFLQAQQARGIGLLGLYALVWLCRSVLEPRLLGRELGLDPLLTLISVYAGYRLLGLLGMLLMPVLAVAITRAGQMAKRE